MRVRDLNELAARVGHAIGLNRECLCKLNTVSLVKRMPVDARPEGIGSDAAAGSHGRRGRLAEASAEEG